MDLFRDTHIDFMKYRKVWVVVSLAVLVAGLIAIFYHGKLNVGIDFAGGTQLTVKFQEQPDVDRLRTLVAQAGFEDAQIQRFGEEDAHEVMIKTPLVEGGEEGSREQIVQALAAEYGGQGGQGLDLNEAGAPAISALLTQADPEGLREPGADDFVAAEAESHYAGVAEAILEARRDVGHRVRQQPWVGEGPPVAAVVAAEAVGEQERHAVGVARQLVADGRAVVADEGLLLHRRAVRRRVGRGRGHRRSSTKEGQG